MCQEACSAARDQKSDADESFGSCVYRLRRELGAQQAEIAAKARVSAGYFSEVENSKRLAPPRSTALRLIRALTDSEAETKKLLALAAAERMACTVDVELRGDIRSLLSSIRAASPRLSCSAVRRLQSVFEEVRM